MSAFPILIRCIVCSPSRPGEEEKKNVDAAFTADRAAPSGPRRAALGAEINAASAHGVRVIADAAEALGAPHRGAWAGGVWLSADSKLVDRGDNVTAGTGELPAHHEHSEFGDNGRSGLGLVARAAADRRFERGLSIPAGAALPAPEWPRAVNAVRSAFSGC
jgi:hypothetical protein